MGFHRPCILDIPAKQVLRPPEALKTLKGSKLALGTCNHLPTITWTSDWC